MRYGLWLLLIISVTGYAEIPSPTLWNQNELSLGYFDQNLLNTNLTTVSSPVFFESSVVADRGWIMLYQYTIFHTEKYFAVDAGASSARWVANSHSIMTLSGFFDLRLFLFRTDNFSPYLIWSIAGPTLLSNDNLSTANLGSNFIFQDFIGGGILLGSEHRFDISAHFYHYSNGDLFVHNNGFNVPLVIGLGYSF